jgi:hypothetical protein
VSRKAHEILTNLEIVYLKNSLKVISTSRFVFQRKKGNEESRIKSDIFCQNGEQSREGS